MVFFCVPLVADDEMLPQSEFLWKCVQTMNNISKDKAKGAELDELEAHRFLEHLGETLTVAEMRARLREIDVDFNRKVAMIEYLMQKFNKGVAETLSAPQGEASAGAVAEAEAMVNAAQQAFEAVAKELEAQREALAAQKEAEDASVAAKNDADQAADQAAKKEAASKRAAQDAAHDAEEANHKADVAVHKAQEAKESEAYAQGKASEAEAAAGVAKHAADAALAAAEEQRKALAEMQALEEALAKKKLELEAKAADGPIVARGRAKAELEQLKAADSLPMRSAKINQEAAVRRFQKAQLRADEEAGKAQSAHNISVSSASIATETRKQAEGAATAAADAATAAADSATAAAQAAHSASMAASAAAGALKAAAAAVEEAQSKTAQAEEVAKQLELYGTSLCRFYHFDSVCVVLTCLPGVGEFDQGR